jgi:hypothetical protein
LRLDVVQEGNLDRSAKGFAIDQRQEQEGHPCEQRNNQDAAPHQFELIQGQMRSPVETFWVGIVLVSDKS